MDETIEERLSALERALTDGDHDLSALAADGETAARVATLEEQVETLGDRVDELDAATQALRGYVGNVRSVNEDVRTRADRALEVAEEAADREQSRGQRETSRNGDSGGTGGQRGAPAETDPTPSEEEPTLELAGDDRADSHSDTTAAASENCPLCDGEAGRASGGQPAGQNHGTDTRQAAHHQRRTDGGLPVEDGGDSEATLLSRIRALL